MEERSAFTDGWAIVDRGKCLWSYFIELSLVSERFIYYREIKSADRVMTKLFKNLGMTQSHLTSCHLIYHVNMITTG